jgi:hypothetical protein
VLATRRTDADDDPVFSSGAFSGRLKIVRALPLHIELVLADLRERAIAMDLQEMVDPVGQAKDLLHYSTEAWIVYFEGRPAVLWGVFSDCLLSDEATVWTVTTNVVDQHPFLFLRGSQELLKFLLTKYTKLVGTVEIGYERSEKWLKWLGFKVGPTVINEGVVMRRFERGREDV